MTDETLMTETTAPTPEGESASNPGAEAPATAAGEGGQTTPEGGEAKAEAAKGAPEQYEFKAPEGREFDPGVLAEYSAIAKELNLSQDDAQKMLDRIAPVLESRQQSEIERVRGEWTEAAKTDTEFGGEQLTENLAVAKKALDAFGTPELRSLLNETGLGNHPEVIRAFYRAGRAISEDGLVSGRKGETGNGDARRLYSASNMNP